MITLILIICKLKLAIQTKGLTVQYTCHCFSIIAHDVRSSCNNPTPIGMESHGIPDESITFNNTLGGYEGRKGRLGLPSSTWCGNSAQSGYMQINLQRIYRICAIATQGGGADNGFFTGYVLQLTADGVLWDFYQENGLVKVCDF